ncbi:MAG: hypothetical protein OXC82_05150 [Rhodobacteraceae bacterium]|nr:hypothetical protein [Paracoccaceae bacterium]MCY4249809.1 hypothetical protein [Paracoccaceae bacterium]MCY4308668.1 hypothetical protein [Paracoccaceae bacterium]
MRFSSRSEPSHQMEPGDAAHVWTGIWLNEAPMAMTGEHGLGQGRFEG